MQMISETLTIYNRYSAGREGNKWARTVITGVSWYKSVHSAITDAGYQTAEIHDIRIPVTAAIEDGKQYVPAGAFKDADKNSSWTIQNGDKVVRGDSSAVSGDDIDFDSRLEREYVDAANVTAFADNRRGDVRGQHWRIEAK